MEKKSGWLSVHPIAHHHFNLSAVKFRDALALHFHKLLLKMPEQCDGCGVPFTFCYALDCRVGGLVSQHHNEIRDLLGDISAMVHKEVLHEPVVRESNELMKSQLS